MIDTKDLLSLFDDEGLVRKYLQSFAEDMPELLQKMRRAQHNRDWNELSIHAHTYKCQMQYIHEPIATELAYALEKNSSSSAPDLVKIEEQLAELENRLGKSLEEIDRIIG